VQEGDQREVDVHHVVPAGVELVLPDGLEEGQALDVADRAADLGDRDVDRGALDALTASLISLVMCGMTWTVCPGTRRGRSRAITEL
jgi:hypothetical protein